MGSGGSFNCVWCGRPYAPREATDLEAYARLCPDCLGRAQDNEFLRHRLRQGLRARSAAHAATGQATSDDAVLKDYYAARAGEYDDWYLRRGRYSHGPLDDAVWQSDLDTATLWLDGLAIGGEIVELAAGTGWWSPLLAQKGELWLYDAVEEPLERARERLLAHGLRAHIHLRDAWQEPDRRVDALFTGFWVSHIRRSRLNDFLALARRWLKPGGTYAFIDSRPDPKSSARDDPPPAEDESVRRLNDGRQFVIPKIYYEPTELEVALRDVGFASAEVTTTSRFFVLGRATA
ncbi:MAG: class I SAM-dependent methyltransferase [Chloroflexota bacterium]|nr:class I SAM-dependent methyltransferase [Chloroflexota bacterium]